MTSAVVIPLLSALLAVIGGAWGGTWLTAWLRRPVDRANVKLSDAQVDQVHAQVDLAIVQKKGAEESNLMQMVQFLTAGNADLRHVVNDLTTKITALEAKIVTLNEAAEMQKTLNQEAAKTQVAEIARLVGEVLELKAKVIDLTAQLKTSMEENTKLLVKLASPADPSAQTIAESKEPNGKNGNGGNGNGGTKAPDNVPLAKPVMPNGGEAATPGQVLDTALDALTDAASKAKEPLSP